MSRTLYGAYVVLWIFSLVECKVPAVRVTCIFSEDCILPCSFTPNNSDVNIKWYQQDALILSLQPRHSNDKVWLFSDNVSEGNASLLVKQVDTRSKGRYKCVANNVTQTYVIATVEAPISTIFINTDPSGLIRCSTKEVYPAPMVQWSTKPSLPPAALQPITRMAPGGKGLFTVESVLKQQNNSLDHIYVCNITSKYGTQTWTASLKLQEMNSSEGQDLIIPCRAPKDLQSFSLVWTFTTVNKTTDVLEYDSRTHKSSRSWDHAELEEENALKGDVSLNLQKPVGSKHSGIYTCALSGAKTRHVIQTRVVFTSSRQGKDFLKYNLWMLGIVAGLIALLAITLVIKKYRAKLKRNQENAEEDAEMQSMNSAKTLEEPEAGSKLLTEPSGSHS
ncbi:CD276 antigen homolog [Rhinichthys klamathensis goyatoka]|uniref:CD276 antigen homolog n=1 Tax=Rhinichthys klamathensis goyatoka TaxID=3034132 RepID=UPI0024B5AF2A|nr:CD276 antigen homolog [Rhinichthys klamathensis goyatoka]